MSHPQQITAPTLCPTFENESKRIWKDFEDTYLSGLSPKEETITDNLLLAIQRAHPYEVVTWQFDKPGEAKSGADWEWWLTNEKIWVGLLIQAKRLDPKSHKYPGIKHKVGAAKKPQIDLLIEQAGLKNIDPLYFFYNYSTAPIDKLGWNCQSTSPLASLLGCTVAHAHAVKSMLDRGGVGLPKMSAISLPMRCLVCCPVLGEPDNSLPSKASGVAKNLRLRGDAPREGVHADRPQPRKRPPAYIERLLDTAPDRRRSVIEALRGEVGPVGTVVVIKQRLSDG